MAVVELARMLFAGNTLVEKASSAVGLSKRAIFALEFLYLEDKPEATMTNQDLQDRFIKYNISTDQSAQKDASTAKSELLEAEYIKIQGKVSVFALTDRGRDIVLKMHEAARDGLERLGPTKEQSVLRDVVSLPNPKPPASEKPNKSLRQKSS